MDRTGRKHSVAVRGLADLGQLCADCGALRAGCEVGSGFLGSCRAVKFMGRFGGRNRAPDVIRLGDLDLYSAEDDRYAQQFGIAQIIRHPEHKFAASYHDVALLKLDGKVTLSLVRSLAWRY